MLETFGTRSAFPVRRTDGTTVRGNREGEVLVRIVVIMVAVAGALLGMLLGEHEGPAPAESEPSDIALFV